MSTVEVVQYISIATQFLPAIAAVWVLVMKPADGEYAAFAGWLFLLLVTEVAAHILRVNGISWFGLYNVVLVLDFLYLSIMLRRWGGYRFTPTLLIGGAMLMMMSWRIYGMAGLTDLSLLIYVAIVPVYAGAALLELTRVNSLRYWYQDYRVFIAAAALLSAAGMLTVLLRPFAIWTGFYAHAGLNVTLNLTLTWSSICYLRYRYPF